MSKSESKASKFKVGDHVIVIHSPYIFGGSQVGCTGVIISTGDRVRIQYDYVAPTYDKSHIGGTNTYRDTEIEHSEIYKSPLYQALL